jgi:DNA mismatch endonuclease (patch repair protein)
VLATRVGARERLHCHRVPCPKVFLSRVHGPSSGRAVNETRTDHVSAETRSRIMAAVRSRGGRSTERRLRAALIGRAIAGWRIQATHLPGQPDFYFPKSRVAIFVDGCFWHGCSRCYRRPRSSQKYWDAKVAINSARDRRTRRRLHRMGWRIVRIWEHDVKRGPTQAAERIKQAISAT